MTTPFRSGFAAVVGRPNVGKSTLVNRIVGSKVAIVSPRPQTTRAQVRGVRTTEASQLVLIDTPGIHKPRTTLGERTNERAISTLDEVDVVCLVVEGSAPIGRGDRFIADLVAKAATPKVLVVSKTDIADRGAVAQQLAIAARDLGDFDAFVPLSARTGAGVDALVGELESRLPPGPVYYPDGVVSDQPETVLAAELLREKLLAVAREELVHSIAVVVEELEDDGSHGDTWRVRAHVLVERDSQRAIVIGRGGTVLRDAGTAARKELEALFGTRVYLETVVRVEPSWQRRAHALDRLGF